MPEDKPYLIIDIHYTEVKEIELPGGDLDEKRYGLGEDKDVETRFTEPGKLFRDCQKKYGRCDSKVYIDVPGSQEAKAIGWVFRKKQQYQDCEEFYIQETWITVRTAKREMTERPKYAEHYYPFK